MEKHGETWISVTSEVSKILLRNISSIAETIKSTVFPELEGCKDMADSIKSGMLYLVSNKFKKVSKQSDGSQ